MSGVGFPRTRAVMQRLRTRSTAPIASHEFMDDKVCRSDRGMRRRCFRSASAIDDGLGSSRMDRRICAKNRTLLWRPPIWEASIRSKIVEVKAILE